MLGKDFVMGNQVSYSKAFKLQVVQDALDPKYEKNLDALEEMYGVHVRTICRWRDQYIRYGEAGLSRGYKANVKAERIAELEKEVKDLRMENEILKKAAAFLADAMRK